MALGLANGVGSLRAITTQAMLYGHLTMLFGISTILTSGRHNATRPFRPGTHGTFSLSAFINPMFLSGVILYLFITAHWICTFAASFGAFGVYENMDDILGFPSIGGEDVFIAQTVLLMLTLLTGDTIMVYRLWLIYNRERIYIVFPLCTLLGLAISCTALIPKIIISPIGGHAAVLHWGNVFVAGFVFTVCTNIYSTGLIAWRIWHTYTASTGGRLMRALATFVESVALYTAWEIFFLICYETEKNIALAFFTGPPIIGISYMLLSVRVNLRRAHIPDSSWNTWSGTQDLHRSACSFWTCGSACNDNI